MKKIKTILIIGGGSAGWMTAAYFSSRQPDLKITLIESMEVSTISVGESTNPITRIFHERMQLDERIFMRFCNATYKIAIKFENFSSNGQSFYHPFGKPFENEVKFRSNADLCYLSTLMSKKNKFDIEKVESYGFQLDASLYGEFLKQIALKHGVEYKIKTINNISYNDNGYIEDVDGNKADLYVDCTGFKSILFKNIKDKNFFPINDYLLNDRAVVINVPYIHCNNEMKPYTNCRALSAGWAWDIPLWNRRSVGYVYSSSFLTEEKAEEELRGNLGSEKVNNLSCRHIKIRQGRFRNSYVKNWVGIGLSSGFIEPLESTGLALAQKNIMNLESLLNSPEAYNHITNALFDSTVDFILAHFVLTQRDDTEYWRFIKFKNPITHSLKDILQNVKRNNYNNIEFDRNSFYKVMNWNSILSGMGIFDKEGNIARENRTIANSSIQSLANDYYVENMPNHYEFLRKCVHN